MNSKNIWVFIERKRHASANQFGALGKRKSFSRRKNKKLVAVLWEMT